MGLHEADLNVLPEYVSERLNSICDANDTLEMPGRGAIAPNGARGRTGKQLWAFPAPPRHPRPWTHVQGL